MNKADLNSRKRILYYKLWQDVGPGFDSQHLKKKESKKEEQNKGQSLFRLFAW
jgi:hypothetical protein